MTDKVTDNKLRVLICGSRNWEDKDYINEELIKIINTNKDKEIIIIHGAARGADSIAGEIGTELNLMVEVYPANWKQFGRAAGPVRNQEMLDSGVDLIMAFSPDLQKSKGTKDMVSRGRRAGVQVLVFEADEKIKDTLF